MKMENFPSTEMCVQKIKAYLIMEWNELANFKGKKVDIEGDWKYWKSTRKIQMNDWMKLTNTPQKKAVIIVADTYII